MHDRGDRCRFPSALDESAAVGSYPRSPIVVEHPTLGIKRSSLDAISRSRAIALFRRTEQIGTYCAPTDADPEESRTSIAVTFPRGALAFRQPSRPRAPNRGRERAFHRVPGNGTSALGLCCHPLRLSIEAVADLMRASSGRRCASKWEGQGSHRAAFRVAKCQGTAPGGGSRGQGRRRSVDLWFFRPIDVVSPRFSTCHGVPFRWVCDL